MYGLNHLNLPNSKFAATSTKISKAMCLPWVYDEFRQQASSPLTDLVFSLVPGSQRHSVCSGWALGLFYAGPSSTRDADLQICRELDALLEDRGGPTAYSIMLQSMRPTKLSIDGKWVLGIVFTGIPRMENKL